jgi:hypothetical protein
VPRAEVAGAEAALRGEVEAAAGVPRAEGAAEAARHGEVVAVVEVPRAEGAGAAERPAVREPQPGVRPSAAALSSRLRLAPVPR